MKRKIFVFLIALSAISSLASCAEKQNEETSETVQTEASYPEMSKTEMTSQTSAVSETEAVTSDTENVWTGVPTALTNEIPEGVDYDEYYVGDMLSDVYYRHEPAKEDEKIAESLIFNSGSYICCQADAGIIPAGYFGQDKYIEFYADTENKKIAAIGFVDFIPMDDEILNVINEASYRDMLRKCDFRGGFEEAFERIGNDDEREETYYRVPAEIAKTRKELCDYISDYHTDGFYQNLEEELFGGDYPLFKEDNDGMIYVGAYRGVPDRFDFENVRLAENNGDTARAFVMGDNIGGENLICEYKLKKQDGIWLVDSEDRYEMGEYFGLTGMVSGVGWTWLDCIPYPFGIKSGDSVTVNVKVFCNTDGMKIFADDDGMPCSIYCVKEEEDEKYNGDTTALINKKYSSEYGDELHEYQLAVGESGKYLIYASWKFIDVNGETHEVSAGPMRIVVE